MEPKNRWWIWLVVLILIVAGIYLFTKSREANETLPGTTQQTSGANSLSVSDQAANTLSAHIDSVTLNAPGFIAIHEDSNGQSGADVAASSLLQAGTHNDVSITANLIPGKFYWAMLHLDNGNGVFSEDTDPMATNANGDLVNVRFQVKAADGGAVKGETKG